MKKILLLSIACAMISFASYAQYFQGSFENTVDPGSPPTAINQIVFKMKPTADITTAISYMEFAFRYLTTTTPAFTVTIVNNTTNFPGLDIQRLPDFIEGAYTYVKFVHNTGVIPSAVYANGVEKDIFAINLVGASPNLPLVEMTSDLPTDNYGFGIVNGAGVQIDPGAGAQLYGPGYHVASGIQLVPLSNIPLPVKFLNFTAVKKDNTAVLNWQIENETSLTDHYEVERSLNGVDFKDIVSIASKNNGSSSNSYTSTDADIFTVRSSGVIYYRIEQVDKDGRAVYTEIKTVHLDSKSLSASIYPNPVKGKATLSMDLVNSAAITILINDANGKRVQYIELSGVKGLNTKTISMDNLAAGAYKLQVQAGSDVTTLSVVKTN